MVPEQVTANISSDLATLSGDEIPDQVERAAGCLLVHLSANRANVSKAAMGANGDSQPRCTTLRALLTHPPSQKHGAWRKSWAEHTQILGFILYGQATVGTWSASQSCHMLPFAFSNVAKDEEPLTPQDRAHRLSVVCACPG